MQETYGDIDALTLGEVERPVPAEDEVLIRVRAASVHPDVSCTIALTLRTVLRAPLSGRR